MNREESESIAYELEGLIEQTHTGIYPIIEIGSCIERIGNMPKVNSVLKEYYSREENRDMGKFATEYLGIKL